MTLSEQDITARRCTFCPRDVWQLTCAGQRAAQLAIFATPQRRHTAAALVLITSLALETARGVGRRGQLERISWRARVGGTALHTSGKCRVRRAFHLCRKQHSSQRALGLGLGLGLRLR